MNEEQMQEIEAAANFLRGACFDPRIPADAKEAFRMRAKRLDDLVQRALEEAERGEE